MTDRLDRIEEATEALRMQVAQLHRAIENTNARVMKQPERLAALAERVSALEQRLNNHYHTFRQGGQDGPKETSPARFAADTPTPPPTPAPSPEQGDEAAKWGAWGDFIANEITTILDRGEHPTEVGWWLEVARDKAIALGLAAPADRVVCEVTDELISNLIEAAKPNPVYSYTVDTPRDRIRAVLEAACWTAPADRVVCEVTDELVSRCLSLFTNRRHDTKPDQWSMRQALEYAVAYLTVPADRVVCELEVTEVLIEQAMETILTRKGWTGGKDAARRLAVGLLVDAALTWTALAGERTASAGADMGDTPHLEEGEG